MSVATETKLIAPHGGTLVDRTGERPDDVETLEVVTLTSRELSDLDMIACGALSPLEGFMGHEDYESVLDTMRLANGLPWALPVCLAVDMAPSGDRVALADESGKLVAVLDVGETYEYDREREAQQAFRTTDDAHPGVARLYGQKPLYLAGRVTVFERAEPAFPELAKDPADTRAEFAERGWRRVVGFQTRNPIHRAHEYLTKVALETVDGLLIHPLVGDTKSDDVPAATRVECYRVLLDGYYPSDRVVLSAFPAAMRYAGPREAIWHAICRKNYGCSHFIVGRDHAGVGDYYGTYDAQLIFDEFEPHELDIEPMFFEHSFWCKACGSMASAKTCPHGGDDHVFLSGTKVREMLGNGEKPPPEFSRPEVAQVLIEAVIIQVSLGDNANLSFSYLQKTSQGNDYLNGIGAIKNGEPFYGADKQIRAENRNPRLDGAANNSTLEQYIWLEASAWSPRGRISAGSWKRSVARVIR
jgi:sulfate adenylyltransferase